MRILIVVNRSAVLEVTFLFNGVRDDNTKKQTDANNLVVLLNDLELYGHVGTTVCVEQSMTIKRAMFERIV